MRSHTVRGLLLAVALSLSGCSWLEAAPDECRPVDVGGECFAPSQAGFVEHAVASTRAWPQLAGIRIEAGAVIEGFDVAAGQPTWIVPLRSDGRIVAASRFLPFGEEVRLGEVTLYLPPRDSFPTPAPDERLVIFTEACGDPIPPSCLFREHGWRIEQDPEGEGSGGPALASRRRGGDWQAAISARPDRFGSPGRPMLPGRQHA